MQEMSRQGFSRVETGYLRAITFVALLGVSACGSGGPPPSAATKPVSGAYLVLPAVPDRPGVLYFVLQSDDRYATSTDVRRVAVTGTGRAEIHQSMDMGTMTAMRPLDSGPLRNGVNRFCPGALHVMLFDVASNLRPGGKARVQLDFGRGDPLGFDAAVVGFGQAPPRDEPFDCQTKV